MADSNAEVAASSRDDTIATPYIHVNGQGASSSRASTPTPTKEAPPSSRKAGLSRADSLLNVGITRLNHGSRNVISFDPLVFLTLLPCLLLPWLGLPLYQRFVQPRVDQREKESVGRKKFDEIVTDLKADSDDELDESEDEAADAEETKSRSSATAAVTGPLFSPVASPPSPSSLLSSTERTDPFFQWTWSSAFEAVKQSLPLGVLKAWWAQAEGLQSPADQLREHGLHVLEVVASDKRVLTHPRFFNVFSTLSGVLTILLMYFVWAEDVTLTLQSSLLYSLRFYIVAIASFAAVSSVHSQGMVQGYKAVMRSRENELQAIRMKFLTSTSSPKAAAGTSSSNAAKPRLQSSNALQVMRCIDALSKQKKGLQIERRMVWLFLICLLRALIGANAALATGSTRFTSALYFVFHLATGFFFFALAVQTEFELHEDERRWNVFSAIHSPNLCAKMQLPFHVPLSHLPHSQNIVGWYSIRSYLKDLKGRFDFERMQVLLAVVVIQISQIALLPLYWSYFHLNHSVAEVYEHVIGSNLLVAFDTALCISLLMDMVAAGVQINRTCGAHTTMLQEEEMTNSFALTNPMLQQTEDEGIVDSIHQLKALRDRLSLVKESEKLCVYGFKLDEHITTYLRTALVSYALVFGQSLFTKKVLKEQPKTF